MDIHSKIMPYVMKLFDETSTFYQENFCAKWFAIDPASIECGGRFTLDQDQLYGDTFLLKIPLCSVFVRVMLIFNTGDLKTLDIVFPDDSSSWFQAMDSCSIHPHRAWDPSDVSSLCRVADALVRLAVAKNKMAVARDQRLAELIQPYHRFVRKLSLFKKVNLVILENSKVEILAKTNFLGLVDKEDIPIGLGDESRLGDVSVAFCFIVDDEESFTDLRMFPGPDLAKMIAKGSKMAKGFPKRGSNAKELKGAIEMAFDEVTVAISGNRSNLFVIRRKFMTLMRAVFRQNLVHVDYGNYNECQILIQDWKGDNLESLHLFTITLDPETFPFMFPILTWINYPHCPSERKLKGKPLQEYPECKSLRDIAVTIQGKLIPEICDLIVD